MSTVLTSGAKIKPAEPAAIPFRQFLESTPVLERRQVVIDGELTNHNSIKLIAPAIELYCSTPACGGRRIFDPQKSEVYLPIRGLAATDMEFVLYYCRNCHAFGKEFALAIAIPNYTSTRSIAEMYKIGENPAFGEPRPDIITDVLDDEIEYFDRGYRSETGGLGIGAFAYYRRFVDSHKDKLLKKIRQVAEAQGIDGGVMEALDRAARTNSFEKAVEEIKEAIPPVLRLKGGHNPLTLLYEALSVGLHADDDVECLQRAQDIRKVLAALADRMQLALADSKELDSAVARLIKKKTKPT